MTEQERMIYAAAFAAACVAGHADDPGQDAVERGVRALHDPLARAREAVTVYRRLCHHASSETNFGSFDTPSSPMGMLRAFRGANTP